MNKQKTNKDKKTIILSVLITFIMVSSVFGVVFYGFSDTSAVYKYDNFKFKATQKGFETKISGNIYYFDYLPQDVEDISLDVKIIDELKNAQAAIFTSDFNSSYKQEIAIAEFEMGSTLFNIGKQSANAFMQEGNSLPKITCENATIGLPVIQIIDSNVTELSMESGCITLQFNSGFNLKRASSRLNYGILGVING